MIVNDPRFKSMGAAVRTLSSSSALNNGMFAGIPPRDDLLRFAEGAGAIAQFTLDVPIETNAVSRRSISDVVLTLDYTADRNGMLKQLALQNRRTQPPSDDAILISAKHDASSAWHRFLHPRPGGEAFFDITITMEYFPYLQRTSKLKVKRVMFFLDAPALTLLYGVPPDPGAVSFALSVAHGGFDTRVDVVPLDNPVPGVSPADLPSGMLMGGASWPIQEDAPPIPITAVAPMTIRIRPLITRDGVERAPNENEIADVMMVVLFEG